MTKPIPPTSHHSRIAWLGRALSGSVRVAVTVPLLLAVTSQAANGAVLTASRACGWTIVPSRSPGTARNILFAVTGVPRGGGQVWAVGDRISPEGPRFVAPVIDHWNGSAWSVLIMPGKQSNLLGIYAASPANVWAVGFFIIELEHTLPVIDHFDGKAWASVPNPRIGYGVLSGVAGTSGGDIWAVGRKLGRPTVTVIEHYTGHAWTRVPSPSPVTDYIDFGAIKVLSSNDIWVAGDYTNAHGIFRTLIEHYNGHSWRIVPSPNIGSGDNYLSAIAAFGPHQIWAVGRAFDGARFRPLALTWNGHSWKARTLPAAGSGFNTLNGLTAAEGHSLWAVGSAAGPSGAQRTLTERYRDGHWSIVPSPSSNTASDADDILYSTAMAGNDSVWAVGSWTSPVRGKTITMRRCER